MKLPLNAHIDPRKLTDYLLRQRLEDDKSAFLALAGYTADNAARLLPDIREQVLPSEAEFIEQTEYGPKYRIRRTLRGPNRAYGDVDRIQTRKSINVTTSPVLSFSIMEEVQ